MQTAFHGQNIKPEKTPPSAGRVASVPAVKRSDALLCLDPAKAALGHELAVKAINARDFSVLRSYAVDANSDDPHINSIGTSVMFGVAVVFAGVFESVKSKGLLKFTNKEQPPFTAGDVCYAADCGRGRFVPLLNGLMRTMADYLGKVSGEFKVSLPAKKAAEPAEKPAEKPAPIAVEIVGMPARKTTTEIERNGAGEITSSMQVESDF